MKRQTRGQMHAVIRAVSKVCTDASVDAKNSVGGGGARGGLQGRGEF